MSDTCSMGSSTTQLPVKEFDSSSPSYGQPPDSPKTLVQVQSHPTHHDGSLDSDQFEEADAEQYLRFSPARKIGIVAILSFCAFLTPIASTAILTAVPELAKTFDTTGDIINASNALYLAFMGVSSLFWGPLSQIWGRRPIFIASGVLFCIFTAATALSPNLPAYFVFRILAALQGTSFLVVGSSAIGDIYEPRTRASALSWLLSGSLTGPALGPFLGGIVVTFRPWRIILWLLTALTGFAVILLALFFPETIPHKTNGGLAGHGLPKQTKMLWQRISPVRVFVLTFSYPNIFIAGLAAGALVWNQYALLTPIRYVLNPRFHLTSPIQAGLFYLAPGCGYLAGTFVGGRWTDYTVKKYIDKRNGLRIPEDRLRSCIIYICIVTPGCLLVYGWTLDQEVGGIPAPVIAMFLQGVAQLFCFPSLNTYCLDVMQSQGRSAEVVAGNYVFRYVFAALGTGVVLPAINALGVGWFNTISALFLVFSGVMVWLAAVYGPRWREAVDLKYARKAAEKKQAQLP
ncbi:putative MFS transporter [Aspergillus clavatus NRRL 1]|uniref:MFS transporter, putative n=1 Tax=Aspergillus clavatus (strain ATCC 1007 / CBS 513.65 / DSM 816 / NCTC 3887 / NRRL 1 / QM 1276 / 107) TaxID=344612 RepID=A1CKS5_ASPCL|nr:MFS transporter, putative [Aspergillus clavatus NRRL 1]EAW09749.1 MFS transporter, putative [Aspergillus clavatus NRRL 1]